MAERDSQGAPAMRRIGGFRGFSFAAGAGKAAGAGGGGPGLRGKRGFLNFAWGPGDDMVLFASPRPGPHGTPPELEAGDSASTRRAGRDESKGGDGTDTDMRRATFVPMVHVFRFHYGSMRKLMSEAYTVFADLQSSARACPRRSDELRMCLVSASRRYRSALQECIAGLEPDDLDLDMPSPLVEQELEYMKLTNVVWHFCEIVFMSRDTRVAAQVTDWLQEHTGDDVSDSNIVELRAYRRGPPETCQLFWVTIFAHVLLGELDAAAEVISLDSRITPTRDDVPSQLHRLLSTYPRFQPSVGQSEMDYHSRWNRWHSEVVALRRQGVVGTLGDDAAALLEVLAGEVGGDSAGDAPLRSLSNGHWWHLVHESWFNLLKIHLMFSKPVVAFKLSTLSHLLSACFADATPQIGRAESNLLVCLRSVLGGNAAAPLKFMLGMRQVWAATHLADLLWHHETLNLRDQFPGWGVGFRDHMLLEYASLLHRDRAMWQLASNYATSADCPSGKLLAQAFVDRVGADTDRAVHKVASFCASQLSYVEGATTIYRVRGTSWLKRSRYGQALAWLVRSHDDARLRWAARCLLEHCDKGAEEQAVVDCALASVPDKSLLVASPLLMFLPLYRGFQLVLQDLRSVTIGEGETPAAAMSPKQRGATAAFLRKEASRRLHEMLCGEVGASTASACAPPSYRVKLLLIAMEAGLLAGQPSCFSARQAHDLVTAFQDLTVSHRAAEYLSVASDEMMSALKAALAKTLAAAIVDAATVPLVANPLTIAPAAASTAAGSAVRSSPPPAGVAYATFSPMRVRTGAGAGVGAGSAAAAPETKRFYESPAARHPPSTALLLEAGLSTPGPLGRSMHSMSSALTQYE